MRTDWTELARDFQRELLRCVFFGEPIDGYVRETRARLFAGALVYRMRLRRDATAYVHNLPPHVRAAHMLDRPLRRLHPSGRGLRPPRRPRFRSALQGRLLLEVESEAG